jgi:hypothetical protein
VSAGTRPARQEIQHAHPAHVDDRPTIDKPPKGELWDDQDDKGIGKDGTRRNQLNPKESRAGPAELPRGCQSSPVGTTIQDVGRAVMVIA